MSTDDKNNNNDFRPTIHVRRVSRPKAHFNREMNPSGGWTLAGPKARVRLAPKAENLIPKVVVVNRSNSNSGKTTELPRYLAIITSRAFQNALTFNESKRARLYPVADPSGISYAAGKWQRKNPDGTSRQLLYDRDIISPNDTAAPSDADLPILWAVYSIVLHHLDTLKADLLALDSEAKYEFEPVKIYLPDFLKLTGRTKNKGNDTVRSVVEKIKVFSNVAGYLVKDNKMKSNINVYPVIANMNFDFATNTLTFTSPYLSRLVIAMARHTDAWKKTGTEPGKPAVIGKNGKPVHTRPSPTNSYLISPEILRERNRDAIEIVANVVTLIEQAGRNANVHKRAGAIVEQCSGLSQSIQNTRTTSDKNKCLKRAFTKAWELLPKCTSLQEAYKDIVLPGAAQIPTMATLDSTIIRFPHSGKRRVTRGPNAQP